MNSLDSLAGNLRSELDALAKDAEAYFEQTIAFLNKFPTLSPLSNVLTEDHKSGSRHLRERLAGFGQKLLAAVKSSPLLEQTDEVAIRRLLHGMSANLSFKDYQYHEAYVIHDEDQCHGVMPASQEEREGGSADL